MDQPTIDPAALQRIDEHLNAIDRALAQAGMSRAERHQITEDVEAQIADMLTAPGSERAGMVTVDAVDKVLAQLDPPEAYASDAPPASATPSEAPEEPTDARFSRTAIFGAGWACFGVLAALLSFIQVGPIRVPEGEQPPGPAWWQIALLICVGIPGLLAPIGTTLCGIASISQIRLAKGKLLGLPLAVFDAVFYPLAILDGVIIGLSVWLWGEMMPNAADHSRPKLILWVFITAGLIALIDWFIIRVVWRSGRPTAPKPPKPITGTHRALAIVSVVCAGLFIAITGITIAMAISRQSAQRAGRELDGLLALDPLALFYLSMMVVLAGLVCGIAGWRHPLGKVGTILCALLPVVSLVLMA